MLTLLRQTSAIAIDLGTAGARVCQLVRRGGRTRLVDALDVEFEVAGDADAIEQNIGRITRLIDRGCFHGRSVALSLSPPDVDFHVLKVPSRMLTLTTEQVHSALAGEIARETRTAAEGLEVRFWRLPAGHHEGMNVLAVSAPRLRVERLVTLFAQHGLELVHVDATPCALVRAHLEWLDVADREVWAVLDIGAERSIIAVCLGRQPVYVRGLTIGSSMWSQAIAELAGIKTNVAEQLKRRIGLVAESGDQGSALVQRAVRPAVDALAAEVRKCLLYVLNNYGHRPIRAVCLAGGGAQARGVIERLGEVLEVPMVGEAAMREQAAMRLGDARGLITMRLSAALGTCLSAFGDSV